MGFAVKYFTVNDDFKTIIEKEVGEVKSIHQISTGWTNFVYDVKTSNNEYIFRFPRNDFFSDVLEKCEKCLKSKCFWSIVWL